MSEVRVVKFNLKTFAQDYLFLREEGNQDDLDKLEGRFNKFYTGCSVNIKSQVDTFLFNCPIVLETPSLKGFLEKTGVNFQK